MDAKPLSQGTVIMINNDGMGVADRELRHLLIKTYLQLLISNQTFPAAICFYAAGVKLVAADSHVLDELRQLQDQGVYLISCLTCLEYYGLTEELQVGIIGGMSDILETHLRATKIITL